MGMLLWMNDDHIGWYVGSCGNWFGGIVMWNCGCANVFSCRLIMALTGAEYSRVLSSSKGDRPSASEKDLRVLNDCSNTREFDVGRWRCLTPETWFLVVCRTCLTMTSTFLWTQPIGCSLVDVRVWNRMNLQHCLQTKCVCSVIVRHVVPKGKISCVEEGNREHKPPWWKCEGGRVSGLLGESEREREQRVMRKRGSERETGGTSK